MGNRDDPSRTARMRVEIRQNWTRQSGGWKARAFIVVLAESRIANAVPNIAAAVGRKKGSIVAEDFRTEFALGDRDFDDFVQRLATDVIAGARHALDADVVDIRLLRIRRLLHGILPWDNSFAPKRRK